MTIIMCCTWFVLFCLTTIAFWEGKIFNSKAEDVIRDMYDLSEKRKVQDIERRLTVVESSIRRVATLEAQHHGDAITLPSVTASKESGARTQPLS